MKLNDTEMVNAIIAPVIGHAFPQGEDVRYDSDFEMVEAELAKLTSVYKDHKTDPDYHRTSASFNNRAGIAGV